MKTRKPAASKSLAHSEGSFVVRKRARGSAYRFLPGQFWRNAHE